MKLVFVKGDPKKRQTEGGKKAKENHFPIRKQYLYEGFTIICICKQIGKHVLVMWYSKTDVTLIILRQSRL